MESGVFPQKKPINSLKELITDERQSLLTLKRNDSEKLDGGEGCYPGEGRGYLLQYSGLENSTDCIVYGVAKSQT